MSAEWWLSVNGTRLAQGDLLPDCELPVFTGLERADEEGVIDEEVERGRLIVITQSCDLENNKAEFVALCPIHTLPEFEAYNERFKRSGVWESVRKGRVEGLHMLASPESPDDNRSSFVVDFGHIISLPIEYLSRHASSLGDRWRLHSPYLEHFSQAFARFFMRVGLPSSVAPFK